MLLTRLLLPLMACLLVVFLACVTPWRALAAVVQVFRVSIASSGAEAKGGGSFMSLSRDGRFVTFNSESKDLVPNYLGSDYEVYLYDRGKEHTELISCGLNGAPANGGMSSNPSVSTDGRYVVFYSNARNLVPDDTNDADDIFLRDRQLQQTLRVSVGANGRQGNAWSAFPEMSADGRYIVYSSGATNLVPNDTNGKHDIFLYDRDKRTTECVSVSSTGKQGNYDSHHATVSDNGRYVAFTSDATNLVAGDTNGVCDVFLRDRVAGATLRVSISNAHTQGNKAVWHASFAMSADGQLIVFASDATNLVVGDTNGCRDIFIHDLHTRGTRRVSVATDGTQGNEYAMECAISADGRFVVFRSEADTLVPGDKNRRDDIFVHDLSTKRTERVSVTPDGRESKRSVDGYGSVGISHDGRYVGFSSSADNLVPNDTNDARDAYVVDRGTP